MLGWGNSVSRLCNRSGWRYLLSDLLSTFKVFWNLVACQRRSGKTYQRMILHSIRSQLKSLVKYVLACLACIECLRRRHLKGKCEILLIFLFSVRKTDFGVELSWLLKAAHRRVCAVNENEGEENRKIVKSNGPHLVSLKPNISGESLGGSRGAGEFSWEPYTFKVFFFPFFLPFFLCFSFYVWICHANRNTVVK